MQHIGSHNVRNKVFSGDFLALRKFAERVKVPILKIHKRKTYYKAYFRLEVSCQPSYIVVNGEKNAICGIWFFLQYHRWILGKKRRRAVKAELFFLE